MIGGEAGETGEAGEMGGGDMTFGFIIKLKNIIRYLLFKNRMKL